jgi:enoyl-CoA hydratase/carnithine racemase
MSDRVLVSISDGVADVRFNRPDKRNALDGAQFLAIVEAGEALKQEDGVRAVVLSGEGSSFCAGLDFSGFQSMATGGCAAKADEGSPGVMTDGGITHRGQQACWVWHELEVPVIAAVHGHALGGGFQLALAADIRFVHPDTQLSMREVHWGLVPDMTGTWFLARLVRPDVAKELVLTAKIISGTEAGALGVATHVTDTPLDDALALAHEIAGRSPSAIRSAKALLEEAQLNDAATQFAAERQRIGALIGQPHQVEAITANFEKRTPNFS